VSPAAEPLLANLAAVRDRVERAAASAGRTDPVSLLLATKTVPAQRIRVAIGAGARLIGENRVQELAEKAAELADLVHEAHFIGHLQKNKINQVLRYATCIQSLDSVELVDQVAARIAPGSDPLDVFVQVNTSGEASKYGCDPGAALDLARHVGTVRSMHLRGFMTIGLLSDDQPAVAVSYRRLREVRDAVAEAQFEGAEDAHELSMGMSGDLEVAIAEGATMVRVGTAVFGTRPTPDSFYWPGMGAGK
jgi:pyridoxal phosphate enzyme (YggS family)